MLNVIREKDPQSWGYGHNFTHQGPNGHHICLVLEVMSISVLPVDVYRALSSAMPQPLLKRVTKHVRGPLQHLRDSEYGHTGSTFLHGHWVSLPETFFDIKSNNIPMTGPT